MQLNVNKLPEEYQELFIADGGKGIPADIKIKYRSPWCDVEEKKRSKRDYACNIWRTPIGASDVVFDPDTLEHIKENFITPPKFEGEIWFDSFSGGKIDFDSVRILDKFGTNRLKWWGELIDGRPNQTHNYVAGCDISWGLGSSNSVVEFYDVNTGEQCGEWACPNTKPEDFADIVVAICYWIGGVNNPLVIWENNGGQATNFCDRLRWQGYYHLYTQTAENMKSRKRGKKYGWRSGTQQKSDLLQELSIALSEGIKTKSDYRFIKIYSSDLLDELYDYIFAEKGSDAVPSSKADLGTGARQRHGDRVIAIGLCVLGIRDQIKGKVSNIKNPLPGSFAFRLKEFEKGKEDRLRGAKRYLY